MWERTRAMEPGLPGLPAAPGYASTIAAHFSGTYPRMVVEKKTSIRGDRPRSVTPSSASSRSPSRSPSSSFLRSPSRGAASRHSDNNGALSESDLARHKSNQRKERACIYWLDDCNDSPNYGSDKECHHCHRPLKDHYPRPECTKCREDFADRNERCNKCGLKAKRHRKRGGADGGSGGSSSRGRDRQPKPSLNGVRHVDHDPSNPTTMRREYDTMDDKKFKMPSLKDFPLFQATEALSDPYTFLRELERSLALYRVPRSRWFDVLVNRLPEEHLKAWFEQHCSAPDHAWEGTGGIKDLFLQQTRYAHHENAVEEKLNRLANVGYHDLDNYMLLFQRYMNQLRYNPKDKSVIKLFMKKLCKPVRRQIDNLQIVKAASNGGETEPITDVRQIINACHVIARNVNVYADAGDASRERSQSRQPRSKRRDRDDSRPASRPASRKQRRNSDAASNKTKPRRSNTRPRSVKREQRKANVLRTDNSSDDDDDTRAVAGVSADDYRGTPARPMAAPGQGGRNKQPKAQQFVRQQRPGGAQPSSSSSSSSSSTSSSSSGNAPCSHCGIMGHNESHCYRAHPELRRRASGGRRANYVQHVQVVDNTPCVATVMQTPVSTKRWIKLYLRDSRQTYYPLVDTGANTSILSWRVAQRVSARMHRHPKRLQITLADGSKQELMGKVHLRFIVQMETESGIREVSMAKTFEVYDIVPDLILGSDVIPSLFPSDDILNYISPPAVQQGAPVVLEDREHRQAQNAMRVEDDDDDEEIDMGLRTSTSSAAASTTTSSSQQ